MPIQSPQELLAYELQAIQDAEQQATGAMQRITEEAEDDQVVALIEQRLQQGKFVLQEVERSLRKFDGKMKTAQNIAARALIQETEKLMKEAETPELKQAIAIAGLQKLEHYCIAAWGTVKALASETGEEQLVKAMRRAVEEGYQWDRELSELAEGDVNPAALDAAEMSEEDGQETTGKKRSSGGKAKSQGSRKTH